MADYAGFTWCYRCCSFAPYRHGPDAGLDDCIQTRLSRSCADVMRIADKFAPYLPPGVYDRIKAATDAALERVRAHQAVWGDANNCWWITAGGETSGPYGSVNAALTVYTAKHFKIKDHTGWRPIRVSGGLRNDQPNHPARIPSAKAKSTESGPAPAVRRRFPWEMAGSDPGREIGSTAEGIRFFQDGRRLFLVKAQATIDFEWSSLRSLIRLLSKPIDAAEDLEGNRLSRPGFGAPPAPGAPTSLEAAPVPASVPLPEPAPEPIKPTEGQYGDDEGKVQRSHPSSYDW